MNLEPLLLRMSWAIPRSLMRGAQSNNALDLLLFTLVPTFKIVPTRKTNWCSGKRDTPIINLTILPRTPVTSWQSRFPVFSSFPPTKDFSAFGQRASFWVRHFYHEFLEAFHISHLHPTRLSVISDKRSIPKYSLQGWLLPRFGLRWPCGWFGWPLRSHAFFIS